MASDWYTGPIADKLQGADLSYVVSAIITAAIYGVWVRSKASDRTVTPTVR